MIKPIYTISDTAPMKFYRFLVKFSLPVGIVMDFFLFISSLSAHNWLDAAILLTHIIFLFLSIDGLRGMAWSGVRFLYASALLNFGSSAFIILFYLSIANFELPPQSVSSASANAILLLLYWIYFSKRRLLFSPVPPNNEYFTSQEIVEEEAPVEIDDALVSSSAYDQSEVLAAVQRSSRAAEKRLNATEAEIRFASDIAAGIYTADMIPSVMDADKIMELADCYIAEKAFEANDIQPKIILNPAQEAVPSSSVNSYTYKQRNRLLSWLPAICVLLLFAGLCVYSFHANSSSPDTTKGVSSSDDCTTPSLSVDYATSYVGSINSEFIHQRTCRHADNILEKNRVYYKSVDDALADGRIKCSECFDTSSTNTDFDSDGVKLVRITPKNGEIINDTEKEKLAPLTIKASDSSNYYISLKCVDVPGKQYETSFARKYDILKYNMSFYVEGGKTAKVLVPLAEYEIYYATGNTWYGSAGKFGEDTRYFQCEDTFLFEEQWDDEGMYYGGWTLTLYAVPGGNMDAEEISLSEFPS